MKFFSTLAIVAITFFTCTAANALDASKFEQVIANTAHLWEKSIAETRELRRNPPNAEVKKLWEDLDRSVRESKDGVPPEKIISPKDSAEVAAIMAWLRWRVLSEKADSRYGYFYAAYLNHVTDPNGGRLFANEAGIFLLHARLSLLIDDAWCLDRASLSVVQRRLNTFAFFRPVVDALGATDKKQTSKLLLQALTIEYVLKRKNKWADICKHGALTAMNALEANVPRTVGPATSDLNSKSVLLDVSNIEPKFVDESVWQQKRNAIWSRNVQSVSEFYGR
jgi:hypothetical protein